MHDFKMTKTCLGEFVSGGFAILKVCHTPYRVFKPNDVGTYDIPINEREEIFNVYVMGKKWFKKTNSAIMQQLYPKKSPNISRTNPWNIYDAW